MGSNAMYPFHGKPFRFLKIGILGTTGRKRRGTYCCRQPGAFSLSATLRNRIIFQNEFENIAPAGKMLLNGALAWKLVFQNEEAIRSGKSLA
jgi:hypothetical protein